MGKPLVARFCHGLLICQASRVGECVAAYLCCGRRQLSCGISTLGPISPVGGALRFQPGMGGAERHGSEQRTMILWKRRSVAGVTARGL